MDRACSRGCQPVNVMMVKAAASAAPKNVLTRAEKNRELEPAERRVSGLSRVCTISSNGINTGCHELDMLDRSHYRCHERGLTRKTIMPASALNKLAVTMPRATIHKEAVDGDFEAASRGANRGSGFADLLTSACSSDGNSTDITNQHNNSEQSSDCQEDACWTTRLHSRAHPADCVMGSTCPKGDLHMVEG